jgi:hypothetical protein
MHHARQFIVVLSKQRRVTEQTTNKKIKSLTQTTLQTVYLFWSCISHTLIVGVEENRFVHSKATGSRQTQRQIEQWMFNKR